MAIQVAKIGELGTDQVDDIVLLSANPSAGKYKTFESPVSTNYQVPAGKKLDLLRLLGCHLTGCGGVMIGYGDDVVNNSSSPPTNFVPIFMSIQTKLSPDMVDIPIFSQVPAGKYPCAKSLGQEEYINVWGLKVSI